MPVKFFYCGEYDDSLEDQINRWLAAKPHVKMVNVSIAASPYQSKEGDAIQAIPVACVHFEEAILQQ